MTDFAGSEEPARTDEEALAPTTPIVPIAPGLAGVAAPAVIVAAGQVDEETSEGEPETGDEHEDDGEIGIT